MSQFYVGCILGEETGRVVLGQLNQGELQVSEVRRFTTAPLVQKGNVQWNIPHIYEEILEAFRIIAGYDEAIESLSCSSASGDYLLFDQERALMTPALHHSDPEILKGREKILERVPWQEIYEETGTQDFRGNTFLQLGNEPGKRLKRAAHVLPIADAFHFILGGEPRVECSMASALSLYNPALKQWSPHLLEVLNIRPNLLPHIVTSGKVLGRLRPDICELTRIDSARIVATCSEESAATMAGLPVEDEENWAMINPGLSTAIGAPLAEPMINDLSFEMGFANQVAARGAVLFHKQTPGLMILEECEKYWEQNDRSVEKEVLSHLAGSSPPFESLIDPADPRFSTPGDMPLKIQAFCRDSNQTVPRKPGPVFRCVLESLALHHRKLIFELEHLTGQVIRHIYVPHAHTNMLLNSFTANALQRPLTVMSGDAAATGNLALQALALGHIASPEALREVLKHSCSVEKIVPHARLWEDAYDRFVTLAPQGQAVTAA